MLYIVFMNKNNKTTATTYACSTLVMKVDYTEVLLIYVNNDTYGSTLQSIDRKRVKDSCIT
jgi:hypothetical protein